MDEVNIREIMPDDFTNFRQFLHANHFHASSPEIFDWYSSLKSTTMFAAVSDGKIIGTGIGISIGTTGWLSSICVDENYRRKGIGRRLTEYGISTLEASGVESVLLRGSELGRELYKSMGFKETGRYENFIVKELNGLKQIPESFSAIGKLSIRHAELDATITGEDRRYVLENLPPSTGFEVVTEDKLEGFIYSTIGDGFLGIARHSDLIPQLILSFSNRMPKKIRTLKGSTAYEFLHRMGLEPEDGAYRMVLGKDPLKKEKNVVGTISSSIG